MAKKINPAKAKAKRDKIIAGALGGVLLVVSVFAVPMTLKQWKKLNGGEQTAAPAQTVPATGTATPPAALPADAGIAGTVSAPLATAELHAFDLFESRDPFDQQVDVPSPVSTPVGTPVGTPAPSRPRDTGPAVPIGSVTAPPTALPTAPKPPPIPPTSAVISVNGAAPELLGIGVEFPLPPAEALFKLESLARGRARISIVGGSYATGAPTVALKLGKTLTLENTADGTRYELKLLWLGTGSPPPGLVPAPPTAAAPTAAPSTPTSPP